jgi:hypothetical protein
MSPRWGSLQGESAAFHLRPNGTQELYDEAKKRGWTVIHMKDDWKRLFCFDD